MMKRLSRIAAKIAESVLEMRDLVPQVGILSPSEHLRKTDVSSPDKLIMQKEKVQHLVHSPKDIAETVLSGPFHKHHHYPELRQLVKYLVEDSSKPSKELY